MPTLRGITWNHSRGYVPMVATAQRFHELHPEFDLQWDSRSLQAFADEPIAELAQRYDLLVIDHPWAGFAARSGILAPLDELLPADFLADLAAHSIGASHESYFENHQWALAIDAACPVASWRADLIEAPPASWDDLLALAAEGRVLMPAIPIDTLMNFYAVCQALGAVPFTGEDQVIDTDTGSEALRTLKELADAVPRECFDLNPIRVYEAMTQRDDIAYCPFAYGYSNYARPGYARRQLRFGDPPTLRGHHLHTTLGGTGLAISVNCKHKDWAARYAQYVCEANTQSTLFFQTGGQPGHRVAWEDSEVNRRCNNFFRDTLATLDRSYLRPRFDGYLDFQDHAGDPIRDYLREGGTETNVIDELNALYRRVLEARR